MKPLDVEQEIDDQLPRTVIGDLPAAIHLNHRDRGVFQQVLALAVEPPGVDSRMLQEPDLVRSIGLVNGGEALHGFERRFVFDYAEALDHRRRYRAVGRIRSGAIEVLKILVPVDDDAGSHQSTITTRG